MAVHTQDPFGPADEDGKKYDWTVHHRVKLDMGNKRYAMITSNWHDVVREAHMKAGEMAIF